MMKSKFGLAFAMLTALGVLTFDSAVTVIEAGQPTVIDIPVNPGTVTATVIVPGDPVPIVNHSFEDPPLDANNFTSTSCNPNDRICVQTPTPVIGWEILGSAGTWNPTATAYPGGVPAGANVAYANSGSDAFISQTLETLLERKRVYTLQVDIGRRADDQFPGYKVQLWAGDTLLAEDDNSLTPDPGTFATSTIGVSIGSDHPALGAHLEIVLISNGRQTNFDNVRLTFEPFAPRANVTFYVKLDGSVEKVIAWNGALQLRARCEVDGADRSVTLFLTSTQPGWFAQGGPFDAGVEFMVVTASGVAEIYGNTTNGVTAAAPDGSYIGVVREGTGVGVNIFGHDCVAIGTALLVNDAN